MITPSIRLHARPLLAMLVLATASLATAQEPVRRTPGAEAFRAALDMTPPTAVSVVVVPNPKMAADDLAECMARLDQAAGALPLRPLDLLKSRFGIGPGIDDTRAFVMWHEVDPDQTARPQVPAMLVPVTDAKAFLEGNFKPAGGDASAWTNDNLGTVYVRSIDRHVLISSSAAIVNAYGMKPGFAASLKQRLGDRGYEVFISGDAGAWAGLEAMQSMRDAAAQAQGGVDRPSRAASARRNADAPVPTQSSAPGSTDPVQRADLDGSGTIDNGDLSMLMLEMGNRGNLPADLNGDGIVNEADADMIRGFQGRTVTSAAPATAPAEAPADAPAPTTLTPTERANQIADGVTDGVFAIDMDPLGVSVRTYAVMDPKSELGQSARGGTRGAPAQLTRLPKGAFVVAGAADMQGLGGADAFIDLLKLVPGAPELPAWVRENRNLLTGMQFAIYPSKLGLAGGGLLNEAMLWMSTTDSAKASTLLRDWMQGLAGVEGTTERKVTWEAGKVLKDGATRRRLRHHRSDRRRKARRRRCRSAQAQGARSESHAASRAHAGVRPTRPHGFRQVVPRRHAGHLQSASRCAGARHQGGRGWRLAAEGRGHHRASGLAHTRPRCGGLRGHRLAAQRGSSGGQQFPGRRRGTARRAARHRADRAVA